MKATIETGSKVNFTGCFMAATVISVNGKTATVDHCGDIIKKRLSSLTLAVKKEIYYNEQELEHMTNQKFNKGDVIFAIISDGQNVIYKQE